MSPPPQISTHGCEGTPGHPNPSSARTLQDLGSRFHPLLVVDRGWGPPRTSRGILGLEKEFRDYFAWETLPFIWRGCGAALGAGDDPADPGKAFPGPSSPGASPVAASPPRAGQGMCWKIAAFPAAPEAQMLPLAAAEGAFCWENGGRNYSKSPSRFLSLPSFSQLFPNMIPGDLRRWSITGASQNPESLPFQLFPSLSPPSPAPSSLLPSPPN